MVRKRPASSHAQSAKGKIAVFEVDTIRVHNVCRRLARAQLAALLLLAGPAVAIDAGCPQWDASGTWTLIQSNNTAVELKLQQNEHGFSGTASFGHWVDNDFFLCSIASCGKDYVGHDGPVVGSIKGNAFEATVYWDDNAVGVYTGEVGPQGLIVGTGFDKNNPSNKAQWHSARTMACPAIAAATQPQAPSAPAKPPVALGRVQSRPGLSNGAPPGICEAASSARTRNSPAAPSLERQCAALVQPTSQPALPVVDADWREAQAARGATLAGEDPLATELRNALSDEAERTGFDYGLAVAEGHTMPGPGKDAIGAALEADERRGFELGVQFSLDRNANFDLASRGAAIMLSSPDVASVRDGSAIGARPRMAGQAALYKLGFNIATGLFGDPALGAVGNTQMGPGAKKIRDALSPAAAQAGFDAAVRYHLAHHYGQ